MYQKYGTYVFSFGKYKNLSVNDVYFGIGGQTQDLIPYIISYRLKLLEKSKYRITNNWTTFSNIECKFFANNQVTIEYSSTPPKLPLPVFIEFANIFTFNNIENFFKDTYKANNLILEESNIAKPNYLFAHPEYINWCIKTISHFALDEGQIKEFESRPINRITHLQFYIMKNGLIQYTFKFKNILNTIPSELKDLNNETILRIRNEDNVESQNAIIEEEEMENKSNFYFSNDCSLCGSSNGCMLSDPQGCPRSRF
ncbi:MAG: hypothetical protein IPI65_05725 [Bacteroidetes bacterium]|nr:hypothetical protein [Bacteroidota bacterium]